ncbi:MAG: helix-turn-helix domain-containing protein [Desulfosudaceae bacterium]
MKKNIVSSGIADVDQLLGGGIGSGDNVIWYDDAGLLAPVFCHNLIRASGAENKSLIYVSFDRSPKILLQNLGPLADAPRLTILDCFSHGKGKSSEIFLDFYKHMASRRSCRIVCLDTPGDAEQVARTIYELHRSLAGDVRFIFDSLTGMQELWGGEDDILTFYASACPRLYELNTIAYWIVEKAAHSDRLKAHLNKITQVALELSLKRGKTYLTVLKAEKQGLDIVNQTAVYWSDDQQVSFDPGKLKGGRHDLGSRLKTLRLGRGLSQNELARQLGVTASNISQVENNQVYPSLPALLKLTEIFSVDIGYFFPEKKADKPAVVFSPAEAAAVTPARLPKEQVTIRQFVPDEKHPRQVPCLVEVAAGAKLAGHFFNHKGPELGYLIAGELRLSLDGRRTQRVPAGDLIFLTSDMPTGWENPGKEPAHMLWIRIFPER